MKKKSEICKLRNLGESSEKMLNEIDVYSLNDIKELGPIIICQILKSHGHNVSPIMAYALQGAIMDLHWNEIPKDIKENLKEEFKFMQKNF